MSKSTEARMTLYRLSNLPSLTAGVKEKYRAQFPRKEVKVGKRDAHLYMGKTERKKVGWADTITGLTAERVSLENSIAAAALLIPQVEDDPSTTWAITFGMGFQLLDQNYVDTGFGQKIAIRAADPTKVSSITTVTLDERSKTARASIPLGSSLRGFGFEDIGELATRLVASGNVVGISGADKPVTIRGADAVSLPLSKKPETFLKNLDALKELLLSDPVNEELGFLEKLSIVKNDFIKDQLDEKLIEALSVNEHPHLGLAWPHETIDEFGKAEQFKLIGTGARHNQDGTPTLEDIRRPVADLPQEKRLKKLNSLSVMLFEADEQQASGKLPARKWLSFETKLEGQKYFLHSGRWYRMDEDYANIVRKRTHEIFKADPDLGDIPQWTADFKDEKAYNNHLADQLRGLCIDAKLISGGIRRGNIEACDVLLPGGVFIHVKHTDSSAPASHLLAQALVSTEMLSYDSEARDSLAAQIRKNGRDPEDFELIPKKVVIIMAKYGKALTADSLYTFSQINLGRQERSLSSRNIEVFVVPILRNHKDEK